MGTSKYSPEFRADAVALYHSSPGGRYASVATGLGVNHETLRTWVREGRDAVEKVTGVRPTLLRPPQGRISDDVTSGVRDLGMSEVVWSADGADKTTDSKLITQRVLHKTKRDGIILLHDLVDPTNRGYNGTVAAVEPIITALQAKGYTFVTVKRLLAPGKPQPGKVYK
ncbi:transposase [Streptomyces sp. NPDC005122]